MDDLITKLNTILADEKICVTALRSAAAKCNDPYQQALTQRVLNNCRLVCTEVEILIVGLGHLAAPNQRMQPQLSEKTLAENLAMVESIQRRLITEIDLILAESNLKCDTAPLRAIRQFHTDNMHWLAQAMGMNPQRDH